VTRFRRILGLLAQALALVAGGAVPAVSAGAQGVDVTRFPFLPSLLIDNNKRLCAIALEQARDRFMAATPDMLVEKADGAGIRWLPWESLDLPEGEDSRRWSMQGLELDLDGRGKKQIVAYQVVPHSWRGENHYGFVFGSRREFQSALRQRASLGTDSREEYGRFGNGVRYYPDGQMVGGARVSGSGWMEHQLFEYQKRYYFLDQGHWHDRLSEDELSIYRLRADGRSDLVCRIAVFPPSPDVDVLQRLPGISSYLQVLRSIGGASGGDCGTLHAEYVHDMQAEAAARRAALRPWAVSSESRGYYYSDRMLGLIEDWGFEEVWNWRQYQTYQEHIPAARAALETYLQRAFGMPRHQAEQVFEEMTAAWILVPKGYEDHRSPDELRRAILLGDVDAVRWYVQANPPTEDAAADIDENRYLLDAVESPEIGALLLDAGADVNITNHFGKTALMTAAHLNRPDVVELLLKRGANVHARTSEKFECGTVIERGERTALMYAAENAGPEVIRWLVNAGADPRAVDSKGNGIDFYLALNPFLSSREKDQGIEAMAKASAEAPRPSFDCKSAKSKTERLVCSDAVLSMQDRYLSAAFQQWLTRAGVTARNEQRDWLKRRDSLCSAEQGSQAVFCLQQATRTRIRYLHNRLAEPTPKP
jgi:ankyrin repeat protein